MFLEPTAEGGKWWQFSMKDVVSIKVYPSILPPAESALEEIRALRDENRALREDNDRLRFENADFAGRLCR